MAKKTTRKVLGRGLNALIKTDTKVAAEGSDKFMMCPVDQIHPNKNQPRKTFKEDALNELSNSIKEKGVIEPLVVRKISKGFELIAGERRWRASRQAGLEKVPVVIMDVNDEESLELAIIENIQRQDLNSIEEAEAYKNLMAFNLSQEEVAKRVGKERATVSNYLRLLKLPIEVKEELINGTIGMGHARALLALENKIEQKDLLRIIVKKGLNVRQTEGMVKNGIHSFKSVKKKIMPKGEITALENTLRARFSTKVLVKDKKGRGRIEIEFYSAEERDNIIDMLLNKK